VIRSKRTVDSFVFVEIKGLSPLMEVKEINQDFCVKMSERTELPIFAFMDIVGIVRTEFVLITVRVIQFLHFVVRVLTVISILTHTTIDMRTALRAIVENAHGTSPIFRIVIKRTMLQIVRHPRWTALCFKSLQIQDETVHTFPFTTSSVSRIPRSPAVIHRVIQISPISQRFPLSSKTSAV
jgi:hypothetical protein